MTNVAAKAIGSLVSLLELEQLEVNIFRGQSINPGWQRVYGGQVLGQALMAATKTVDPERIVHSLHGYFLLAGDPKKPIIYNVESLRDGGSFSTRRIKAVQHGRAIFVMSASFHKKEDGLDHATRMPDVPPPEDLPTTTELISKFIDKLPKTMQSYWTRQQPIDMRIVDPSRYLKRQKRDPVQHIWLKAAAPLPDDPTVHNCILAYASDFTLLDTALIAHGKVLFDPDLQLASLDHTIWFHRPFRADDWLLYAQESPSSQAARGLCRGQVFTTDGTLIASTAQEGLMRQRSPDKMPKK